MAAAAHCEKWLNKWKKRIYELEGMSMAVMEWVGWNWFYWMRLAHSYDNQEVKEKVIKWQQHIKNNIFMQGKETDDFMSS